MYIVITSANEGYVFVVICLSEQEMSMDIRIVCRIRHYWEIRKVVSTDCVERRCTVTLPAPAGIAIATMTPLCHRPLAEVCTVPVLLVVIDFIGM